MGRDAVLILMTFYMRYTTLPHPVRLLSSRKGIEFFFPIQENLATLLGC